MGEGEIEYYAIEGVPGRFFKCPKGVGKFKDTACAGFYTEAMSPKGLREGLRFACRGCPIGAAHAGVAPVKQGSSRFLSQLSCARCLNPSPRLIRGRICVSCYNREREFLRGRNAKGNVPVRARPVVPITVSVSTGNACSIQRIDRATSQVEAVLSVMRERPGASFMFAPAPITKGERHAAAVAV